MADDRHRLPARRLFAQDEREALHVPEVQAARGLVEEKRLRPRFRRDSADAPLLLTA